MKRALFVALPEKGHLYPLLGPAAEAERLGLEVTFWVPRDVRGALADAGFNRVIVPSGRGPPDEGSRGDAFRELLAAPDRLQAWIHRMLVDAAEADVEPLREAIRVVRPDVVAIDPMAYAGALAAQLERVPWVGLSSSLNPVVPDTWDSELIATTRALEPARQALFARHVGPARFRVSDVLSPHGTLAFTTDALVGSAPAGVHLVGPSLPSRPRGAGDALDWSFVDGRPLLYVSFGTQAYAQPERYQRLFEATAGLGVSVLASVGDLALGSFGAAAPSHVRCVSFAPQLEVLPRAAGIVTHGGANSVMEALAYGVPLGVAPLCNDQWHNLRFLEAAGAGLRLDLEGADSATLREQLRTLCAAQTNLRAAVRSISESYARSPGARLAADHLARLVA